MQIQFTQESAQRLDHFLNAELPDFSRTQIQRLITEGAITVNNKPVKKNYVLTEADKIKITIPDLKPSKFSPKAIKLDVIYEDKNIIAINKPAGLSVHPRDQHDQEPTIVNALLAHCPKELSGIGGVLRPGIVHRLDKDTSGILIVAKNDTTHQFLSKQFQDRTVKKHYQTLAIGRIKPQTGRIDAPIHRDQADRKKMSVSGLPNARHAITEYEVSEYLSDAFGAYSLCDIQILTGRTHQIRVHLQAIGYPIVGDRTYGIKKYNDHFTKAYNLNRQFLHAAQLQIKIPGDKIDKKITLAAKLPDDLQKIISELA